MGLRVLHHKARSIADALTKAAKIAGVNGRPLNVLAIYLDSANDIARAYQDVKRDLGAIEVVVLPAPISLDLERMSKVKSTLKKYGIAEADAQRAVAEIIRELT